MMVAPAVTVSAPPGERSSTPATLAEAYDQALRLEEDGREDEAYTVLRHARERYEHTMRLLTPTRSH